ncbi:MAG: branched-chain amino acid ABC transporter substrate-binding protein [Nitrospinota bacterium]|nr:MAG: branched-chain amino acid ABC transporter substrate-binding protein [Nitrospinota bacterium]
MDTIRKRGWPGGPLPPERLLRRQRSVMSMKYRCSLLFTLLATALLLGVGFAAQPREVLVGYLGLEGGVDLGFLGPEGGLDLRQFGLGTGRYSAVDGARMALEEANTLGRYFQMRFALVPRFGRSTPELLTHLQNLYTQEQIRFFLLDVPGSMLQEIAQATRQQEVLLFNVAAIDDNLRQEDCAPHVFHVVPSRAMLADGLVQYLMKRNWKRWLLVTGPSERDQAFAQAMKRAAQRFGARIVDTRLWKSGADIRRTAEAEFPLFTARAEYDVVVVADEEAEFGELLPYHTYLPRPVAGTQGLRPVVWFWGFAQWGATQLNARFIRLTGRKMENTDWASWMAMKMIAEAMVRTRSTEVQAVRAYLLDPEVTFDGYKGPSLDFRPWNHQLRQSIILATPRARVSISPQEGFLHPTTKLDTLGYDRAESRCKF